MNDPHVVAVHYNLELDETVIYQPPEAPVEYSLTEFTVRVDGRHVVLLPQAHYPSSEAVLVACEPLVRAWQLMIAVDFGSVDVRLKYEQTELVDRAPTPGVVELQSESIAFGATFMDATIVRTFNRHPRAPDATLRVTPDVGSLWQRYCGYKRGKEPLLSMAYFVLTVVEALGGNSRPAAARTFNVEESVLRKIGELSSTRGDSLTARKRPDAARPLQSEEHLWLEQAVQKLILQLARSNGAPPLTPLRLADLPAL
jgi:hypothetical protein